MDAECHNCSMQKESRKPVFSIKTCQDNKQTKLPFSCHVASFYVSPEAPVIVASDSTHELHSGAHKIIKVIGQVTSLPP